MQALNRLILIFSLLVSSTSWARECESLKTAFLKDSTFKDADLADLQIGIEGENPCFKNLMGIMLYKGIYFQKDTERAEQIFMDLSNNNYPEAQYNFAITMTKRLDQDPEVITSFLIGLYYKYADDKKNSSLASLSRDLGRKYTESINDIKESCKYNKCGTRILSLSEKDMSDIKTNFEDSIKSAEFRVASARLKLHKDTKDEADTLVSILSLGLIAYNLSYPTNYNHQRLQGINGTEIWNNPWTNGNPLHQYLYQWPKPF